MKDLAKKHEFQSADGEILTIGYEGSDIESFMERIILAEVEVLVDVRELPLSRKRGFSKVKLREAVEAVGIEYLHFRDLGDPKPGRDAAKIGNHSKFIKIFEEHLETAGWAASAGCGQARGEGR